MNARQTDIVVSMVPDVSTVLTVSHVNVYPDIQEPFAETVRKLVLFIYLFIY